MEFGFVIPAFGTFADPAVMADLVVLGEELGFAHVWFGDHDRCALAGHRLRTARADARRRTGHDRDLAVQTPHVNPHPR